MPEPNLSKVLWTIRKADLSHFITEVIQAGTASTDR